MSQIMSKDFLTTKSNTGWTFLLTLCQQNNPTSFVDVIKYLASNLDKKFVAGLLEAKTSEGWTFLHFLAQNNSHTSFGVLLQLLCEYFDLNFVKSLLKSITNQHLTFLSMMSCTNIERSPMEILRTLFDQKKIDKIFITELFLIKSNKYGEDFINEDEGWTFLHQKAFHGQKLQWIYILADSSAK